jgi:membrane-anchored protein YejM (alkaline phosphatase superfamily)
MHSSLQKAPAPLPPFSKREGTRVRRCHKAALSTKYPRRWNRNDGERSRLRPVPSRDQSGGANAALGLAVPASILLVSGLPCVTALHPADLLGACFLFGGGVIHALALIGVLRLGSAITARFLGESTARACFAVCVGALALVIAVDATVYGAVGYHVIGKSLAYLWAPGARQTLGVTRSDIAIVLVCTVLAGVVTFATCKGLPRLRRSIVTGVALVALDGGYSLSSEVLRFEGVRSVVGLTAAMPLAWSPRLNRVLTTILKHPPLSDFHDVMFPSPSTLIPEQRTFHATPPVIESSTRPDILIIAIESARADEISQLPHLMTMADGAVVATDHYSGGNCSFLGLFTLLTGLDPMYWAASETWRAPNGLGTFSALGYRISLKESLALNYGVWGRVQAAGQASIVPTPEQSPPKRDEDTARWTVDWVKANHAGPEFAVVFFDEPHWPYSWDPAGELHVSVADTWVLRKHVEEIRNRYRHALRNVDVHLARIFEAIEARPPERPMITVVTGDHGEAFGEHGVFMHGNRLDDEQLRVPLVMILPGRGHVEVHHRTVHQDVLPTILHQIGGTPVEGPGLGVDFLSSTQRPGNLQVGACAISTNEGLMAFEGDRRVLFQLDRRGTHFVAALEPDDNEILDVQQPWIQSVLAREAQAYEEHLASKTSR